LSSSPKRLSSKYFYDAAGDELFREIMQLPEYYLTRAEYEIFSTQSHDIISALDTSASVRLIELGAGDGLKSRLLLKALLERKVPFTYYPLDISAHTLEVLCHEMTEELGDGFPVFPIADEYISGLEKIGPAEGSRKLILFLGSTVGNFLHEEAIAFFRDVSRFMSSGDFLLVGFDLMKDPEVILRAYNDSAGVTRAFNLNLLRRINRELQADFDIEAFQHYPTYDPLTGETRSFLISRKKQDVFIGHLGRHFGFEKDEPVFMEVSRKFSAEMIRNYAEVADMQIIREFRDCRHYFTDVLMQKK